MKDFELYNYCVIPRTLQEIAKKFFGNRIIPARKYVRGTVLEGRLRVIDGDKYVYRTPDYAWAKFLVEYYNF